MFLLDTTACIRILNNSSPALVSRLKSHSPSQIRLGSVVKAELLYGARKSARAPHNLRVLQRFFEPFRSLSFDDSCSEQCGLIRTELERGGKPIGPYDIMIAATGNRTRADAGDAQHGGILTGRGPEVGRLGGLKRLHPAALPAPLEVPTLSPPRRPLRDELREPGI